MASAPPIEAVMPLTAPLPPSYEEAMNHPYPHCSQNPTYPPPGYGPKDTPVYPVQPQSPPVTCHPVVSVQSVYVQPGLVFSDHPVVMNCPACRQMITTQLEYNSGALAWLSCAGLAIFGFEINFVCERDDKIAFHFNPRFTESDIVCNSFVSNHWGQEERCTTFPFRAEEPFQIEIYSDHENFHVFFDESKIMQYKHRIEDLKTITKVQVVNDINISSVEITKKTFY
ncbi:GRIFN protein, partial [Atractosteus spatula]|nr:GRIFN protein [Atractosteus spatula]